MNPVKTTKSVLYSLAIILHVSPAWSQPLKGASPESATGIANGGHGVDCEGKELVVLDYYHANLKSVGDSLDTGSISVSEMGRHDVISHFKKRFSVSPFFLEQFTSALERLGDSSAWLQATIPLINDSGTIYSLPPECKLVQIALRQSYTVYVNPTLFARLSEAQRGLLEVHEALYMIAAERGQTNSANVRQLIRLALRIEEPKADELFRLIIAAGGTEKVIPDHVMDVLFKLEISPHGPYRDLAIYVKFRGYNRKHRLQFVDISESYYCDKSLARICWQQWRLTVSWSDDFKSARVIDSRKQGPVDSVMEAGTFYYYPDSDKMYFESWNNWLYVYRRSY